MIFIKNAILEHNVIRPTQPIDEIATMYETSMDNLPQELKVPKNVLDSFMIKDQLNPDFWSHDKLNPQIKNKLLKIAKDFFKRLELPKELKIKDVILVGSLANYNWSEYSDVDLHIVVDFSKVDDQDILKKFFDSAKNMYNLRHNIKIMKHDVELYVQDVKEKLSAAAIFSVTNNKWVLKPQPVSFKLDKALVKRKLSRIFDKIKIIKHNYDKNRYQKVVHDVDKIKEHIKKMRQSGLEKGGEFSTENIVFKILRRTDIMELLDTYKNKAYDKLVTLKEES